MAHRFDDVQTFEQDADTIFGMFCDPEYFAKKYAQTAVEHEILEASSNDQSFSIKAKMKMRSDAPVPGFAKKFVSDTMTVEQTDTWDKTTRTGHLEIHIHGAPITVKAAMELVDTDRGAENRMHWEVVCKVPLVGSKLEKMLEDDIRHKAPRDLEVSRALAKDYA
nr:DUF2505 domain-containing protein [Oceanococcus sp. HetDA_MAG_MS8]